MPTEDEREQNLKDNKEVQYYMALVTAWINTKMEHDKTIITLSAAAIGLLITILTTKGTAESWHIWFFGFTFICYLVAIITAILIFQENSVRIEHEVTNQETRHDLKLQRLDNVVRWSFFAGTICFVIIGVLSAIAQPKADAKKGSEKQINGVCCCNYTSSRHIKQAPAKKPASKPTKPQNNCPSLIINCLQDYRYSSCRSK
jgi:hypothetical protein